MIDDDDDAIDGGFDDGWMKFTECTLYPQQQDELHAAATHILDVKVLRILHSRTIQIHETLLSLVFLLKMVMHLRAQRETVASTGTDERRGQHRG